MGPPLNRLRRSQRSSEESFGWRLMIEIEPGLTKEQRKVVGPFGATDIFVLVYSQLKQNDLLLFHVEKNRVLNRVLDTTYRRDV